MRDDVTFSPQWVRDAELDLADARAQLRRVVGLALMALVGVGLLLSALRVDAQDKPVFVVASPALTGAYRGTVMLARPVNGGHVGVILNRPSEYRLAQLFPDHPPSAAVTDPVYLGGPRLSQIISAMVRAEKAPHAKSLKLAPGIWLVFDAATVDLIIETTPNEARYYAGFVVWKPGELASEISQGMVLLRPFDPGKLFLPDTRHLHEELVPKKGQVGV